MSGNYCVCCGRDIPEGQQVCEICEKFKYSHEVDFLRSELKKAEANLNQTKFRQTSPDERRALLYRKYILSNIIKALSEVRYE